MLDTELDDGPVGSTADGPAADGLTVAPTGGAAPVGCPAGLGLAGAVAVGGEEGGAPVGSGAVDERVVAAEVAAVGTPRGGAVGLGVTVPCRAGGVCVAAVTGGRASGSCLPPPPPCHVPISTVTTVAAAAAAAAPIVSGRCVSQISRIHSAAAASTMTTAPPGMIRSFGRAALFSATSCCSRRATSRALAAASSRRPCCPGSRAAPAAVRVWVMARSCVPSRSSPSVRLRFPTCGLLHCERGCVVSARSPVVTLHAL